MKLGHPCFRCNKTVDQPLVNKYWCSECHSKPVYTDLAISTPLPSDDDMSERELIIEALLGFFGGDAEKVALWMSTPNPLLGGIIPEDMLKFRPGYVLSFVERQLDDRVAE